MKMEATRDGFGRKLCQLMAKNKKIVVVTADLRTSTRVAACADKFPERFFEVGVAEQNLALVAAGLALGGKTVFATSFACFSPAINWAQIRQSICFNRLNVKIIGSHAGLATGPDGPTHQALEDFARTLPLPHLTVAAAIDAQEAGELTALLAAQTGPAYLRLTRPPTRSRLDFDFNLPFPPLAAGQPRQWQRGKKLTIIGAGPILFEFLHWLPDQIWRQANIFSVPFLKPLDPQPILNQLRPGDKVIVIEDHQKQGGLGSLLAPILLQAGIKIKWQHLAVDNRFGHDAHNFRALWHRYIFQQFTAKR